MSGSSQYEPGPVKWMQFLEQLSDCVSASDSGQCDPVDMPCTVPWMRLITAEEAAANFTVDKPGACLH
jgi:hypothetical protein